MISTARRTVSIRLPLAEPFLGVASGEGALVILEPVGHLDGHTADTLNGALEAAIDGGAREIVIDGGSLCYMNSDALGVIIGTVPELREAGGDLKLANFSGKAATIIELLGLDQVVEVLSSVEEAIAAFDRPLPASFDPRAILAATARGARFHRFGCRFLTGSSLDRLRFFRSAEEARRTGCAPCRVCRP